MQFRRLFLSTTVGSVTKDVEFSCKLIVLLLAGGGSVRPQAVGMISLGERSVLVGFRMFLILKSLLLNQLRIVRDRLVLERVAAQFEQCRIDPRAQIRIRRNCLLQFGRNVSIGAYTVIWVWPEHINGPGPSATLQVGDFTYFGELNNIRVSGVTRIGSKCQISQGVSIIGSNHSAIPGIPIVDQPWRTDKVDVTIEDDVWIGTNATILPGVTIGRGSIVAAGSVVTKSVPPNVIVAGVPARLIGERK
jgi:acetyltransferase-like isoleucine patch superfamily enzyme